MRLYAQENPLCQRMSCDHPLKGGRREGHFDMGMGPCKAPGCTCGSFQYTDPTLLLEMRRPRLPGMDPFGFPERPTFAPVAPATPAYAQTAPAFPPPQPRPVAPSTLGERALGPERTLPSPSGPAEPSAEAGEGPGKPPRDYSTATS